MTNQPAGFAALADPTRRRIFERIARRPVSVGAIAEEMPVTRPAVSQHLRILQHAGLVTHDRHGTRRLYRLNPHGIEAMRAYLDRFWDRALAAFKAAAEKEMDS
jgi:DNA-binding transcriptional ArsR family regulator